MTKKLTLASVTEQIDNAVSIAKSPGNADVNQYMLGMANGLILAQSIAKGTEPVYLTSPEKWLCDQPVGSLVEAAPLDGKAIVDQLMGEWIQAEIDVGRPLDAKQISDVRMGVELVF